MVSVRRAGLVDLPALQLLSEDLPDMDWQHWLNATDYFTDLAEDTRLFGFVTVGPADNEATGEIAAFYVKPDHRRHGVGKKLLVRGLTVLKRRGYESAQIWLPPDALSAIQTLAALKFEADGTERYLNAADGSTRFEVVFKLSLDTYF